ncbi:MAG: hypothetical protein HQL88_08335 [Magnetococcales bacterium]|nr:hypothetical protein [Magnetococcales bacterium]
MSESPKNAPAVPGRDGKDRATPEKPLPTRMQRLLTGQPLDDVILDPDNPNLIQERERKPTS